MERKLAAILVVDAVGYSTLMERDEAGTFDCLKANRNELFEPEIRKRHGRIFKLSLELAEDPEFAADTLQPLKMQGIDSFGHFAIVLRMKLMTKPATQFGIKRKAYMMIMKAFAENGIKIAVPTVDGGGGGDAAAAAGQIVKMNKDAALISAQAANEA